MSSGLLLLSIVLVYVSLLLTSEGQLESCYENLVLLVVWLFCKPPKVLHFLGQSVTKSFWGIPKLQTLWDNLETYT